MNGDDGMGSGSECSNITDGDKQNVSGDRQDAR